jgi:hypothetical protein
MFLGHRTQMLDLPVITAAPFAEDKMATQTDPFEERQPAVERG